MTTFNFKAISPRRKAQLRLIGGWHTQLANALQEEWLKRGLTRRNIADLLGWDRAALTRKLKESANITIGTLADLSFALDREALVFLVRRDKAQDIKNCVSFLLAEATDHDQPIQAWIRVPSGSDHDRPVREHNETAGTSVARYPVYKVKETAVPVRQGIRRVA